MPIQAENFEVNGVPIPVADAQAREDIATINQSLAYKDIVTNLDVTTSVVTKTIPSIANANDVYLFGKVNSTYRGSLVVPYSVFSAGISCYIPVIGGNVTGTIYVEYVSDTSVKVSGTNSVFNYLDIKVK